MPEDFEGLIQVKEGEAVSKTSQLDTQEGDVSVKNGNFPAFPKKPICLEGCSDETEASNDCGSQYAQGVSYGGEDSNTEEEMSRDLTLGKVHQGGRHKEGSTSSNASASSYEKSKVQPLQLRTTGKKINKFYQRQTDLLENFKNDNVIIEDSQRRRHKGVSLSSEKDVECGKLIVGEPLEEVQASNDRKCTDVAGDRKVSGQKVSGMSKAARWLAMATLIVNVSLVIAKAAASYLSGSLSIISSLVDSGVDITSGLVIWLTARAIEKHDPYMYPRGRTRLEPLALIIVSVIMGVASIQMTAQSVQSIIRHTVDPHVGIASLCIMIATVVIKFILMLLCKKFDYDASISVLGQDHRNDCLSNLAALFCAWAASKYWIYLDPIGAILVSVYIAITWFFTGKEHLVMLSGKSAKPEFINRIVRVCVQHSPRINCIDTVYVYHYGTRYLVEVHVVMDPYMTLHDAHDISEALQNDIESLPQVERAFVHCDYEFSHRPHHEHKIV